jgi:hypothetical protein
LFWFTARDLAFSLPFEPAVFGRVLGQRIRGEALQYALAIDIYDRSTMAKA